MDPDIEASKEFLMEHIDCEPWDEVVRAWNKMRDIRAADLATKNKSKSKKKKKNKDADEALMTVDEFLDIWKNLKSVKGPELISLDFQFQFQSASELSLNKMEDLVNKLWERKTKQKTRSYQEKIRESLNEIDASDDENYKFCARVRLLPYLVCARGRLSPKQKTDVVLSRDSIMILVKVMPSINLKFNYNLNLLI